MQEYNRVFCKIYANYRQNIPDNTIIIEKIFLYKIRISGVENGNNRKRMNREDCYEELEAEGNDIEQPDVAVYQ